MKAILFLCSLVLLSLSFPFYFEKGVHSLAGYDHSTPQKYDIKKLCLITALIFNMFACVCLLYVFDLIRFIDMILLILAISVIGIIIANTIPRKRSSQK